jgi:aminomethyltransferase
VKKTPLHDRHVSRGARMVEYAGWSMPVQYSGVIGEHRVVREGAGLFDVSHMGEISVSGPGAEAYLNFLFANDVERLTAGRCQYSVSCNERGGTHDDLLVYRRGEDRFLVVVNAANTEKMVGHLRGRAPADVVVEDETAAWALLALQGPEAAGALGSSALAGELPAGWEDLRRNRLMELERSGGGGFVSRTGYTGEDGFEIFLPAGRAAPVWDDLLERPGLDPVGLAARDTLRFEAGYCLYGHELDEDISPLEAGLSWVVKLAKGDFLGRAALLEQKERGVPRALVGLEVRGRSIARQGAPVLLEGAAVGRVTSGTFAPYLERSLALALVERGAAEAGEGWTVEIRGRRLEAARTEIPFYKRER